MVSFINSDKSHSLFTIESPALLDVDDNRTITSHSDTLSEQSSSSDENVQINTGRWSSKENTQFLEAVIKYKCNWKKIQKSIKTRTTTQARSHAQKIFLKIKNKNLIPGDKRINTIQEFFELFSQLPLEQFKKIYFLIVELANEDNKGEKKVNKNKKKKRKNIFAVIHNINNKMKQSNNDKFDSLDFMQKSDPTVNSTSSFKQEDYFMNDFLGEKDFMDRQIIDKDYNNDIDVIFSSL